MRRLERVLFVSGTRGGGTLRYRVRLAEEALRSRGVQTEACFFTDPRASLLLPDADVLALYRVPATPWLHELVRRANKRGIPVTYDIDDLVFRPEHLADLEFLPTLSERERQGFLDAVPQRATAARWAVLGSGTTRAITDQLEGLIAGPIEIVPNGVGRRALAIADAVTRPAENRDDVVFGYFSGSNTHDADWRSIEPDVAEALREFRSAKLLLVGPVETSSALDDFGERIRRIDFVNWEELFELVASVDVNLAPLTAGPFTNGKSAIKWLEAALVETPTVATATEPNRAAINDGVDGILVAPGQSWSPALHRLAADGALRATIGEAARHSAVENYGPSRQADRYQSFFTKALSFGTSAQLRRARYRVPKAGPPLEGYPFDSDLTNAPLCVNRWSQFRLVGDAAAQLPARVAGRIKRSLK